MIRQTPVPFEIIQPLDLKSVWAGMEECQNLGLTKGIGVSNFSCKRIEELLSIANIPPAINQVSFISHFFIYQIWYSLHPSQFYSQSMRDVKKLLL